MDILDIIRKTMPFNMELQGKFNGKKSTIEIYSNENKQRNPCMTLTLTHTSGKYALYIDFLRYTSKQTKCSLSGTTLIKWVVSLYKKRIINNISLYDASSYTIPKSNVKINLTIFRKFTNGKGWYESHGFFSDVSENKRYQNSFIKFEKNSISNLCLFIYYLLKPMFDIKNHTLVLKRKTYSTISLLYVDYLYTEDGFILKNYCNVMNMKYNIDADFITEILKYEYSLIYILMKFGVTLHPKRVSHLTTEEMSHYFFIPRQSKPCTCILKALTPGNTRNIMEYILKVGGDGYDDVIEYMSVLHDILMFMIDCEILYVPTDLKYTTRRRAYKKSTERCVNSYKKKCVTRK
jgi:hypothetical protein